MISTFNQYFPQKSFPVCSEYLHRAQAESSSLTELINQSKSSGLLKHLATDGGNFRKKATVRRKFPNLQLLNPWINPKLQKNLKENQSLEAKRAEQRFQQLPSPEEKKFKVQPHLSWRSW